MSRCAARAAATSTRRQRGHPHEGFPAGTPWSEIPADWVCPDCGVREQADFELGRAVSDAIPALHALRGGGARAVARHAARRRPGRARAPRLERGHDGRHRARRGREPPDPVQRVRLARDVRPGVRPARSRPLPRGCRGRAATRTRRSPRGADGGVRAVPHGRRRRPADPRRDRRVAERCCRCSPPTASPDRARRAASVRRDLTRWPAPPSTTPRCSPSAWCVWRSATPRSRSPPRA